MKRLYIIFIALVVVMAAAVSCKAQKAQKAHIIGFYNLENLFDTYHDGGKNDYEYLPDGANKWTEAKYNRKLQNMVTVIRAMRDENKVYHTVLGVSEVRRGLCPAVQAGSVQADREQADSIHV